MAARWWRMRAGVSMLEVLCAAVIAALMALPVISLLFTSTHESMVSEDYMFAESLAQRYLAETMSIPWMELRERLPMKVAIKGIPSEDRVIAKYHSEYARNLEGDLAFSGTLEVQEIEPGLLKFEISLTWPVRPGASANRRYALVRFRCRHDLAVATNFRLTEVEQPGGS